MPPEQAAIFKTAGLRIKTIAQECVPSLRKMPDQNKFDVIPQRGAFRLQSTWIPEPLAAAGGSEGTAALALVHAPTRCHIWPHPGLLFPAALGRCGCPHCGSTSIATAGWSKPIVLLDPTGPGLSLAQTLKCCGCNKHFQSTDDAVGLIFYFLFPTMTNSKLAPRPRSSWQGAPHLSASRWSCRSLAISRYRPPRSTSGSMTYYTVRRGIFNNYYILYLNLY